jgi:hypothetical protein
LTFPPDTPCTASQVSFAASPLTIKSQRWRVLSKLRDLAQHVTLFSMVHFKRTFEIPLLLNSQFATREVKILNISLTWHCLTDFLRILTPGGLYFSALQLTYVPLVTVPIKTLLQEL